MVRRGCYFGAVHQVRESKGLQGELSRASDALWQKRYGTAAATVPSRSDIESRSARDSCLNDQARSSAMVW